MNKKLTKLAAGIVLSLGVVGTANAGAIAQGILAVTNFRLAYGDGAAGGGTNINPAVFTNFQGANSGDVSASFGGAAPSTDTANVGFGPLEIGDFAILEAQGPDSGIYVPVTQLFPPATLNFSGSYSQVTGNALLGNASGIVDNTVSLSGSGEGTAQSNTGLNSTTTFDLAEEVRLQISFDAAKYLRAQVDAPAGSAEAAISWVASLINDDTGDVVFEWNGQTITEGSGTVYASAFSLNQTRSAFAGQNRVVGPLSGSFELETGLLSSGTYVFSVNQTSSADATYIPEPGTITLLGLGLLGIGATARRRIKS